MHDIQPPTGLRRDRGAVLALLPTIALLSRFAGATPATRSVEVEFRGVGAVSVAVRGSDTEYVELVRHVFDAIKSDEIGTSPAQYLVAPSVEVGDVARIPLPAAADEAVVDVPVSIPIPLSLGAGEYCEIVEATVVSGRKATQTFYRRSCFVVDDAGTAAIVSPAELSISQPTLKGIDRNVTVPEST